MSLTSGLATPAVAGAGNGLANKLRAATQTKVVATSPIRSMPCMLLVAGASVFYAAHTARWSAQLFEQPQPAADKIEKKEIHVSHVRFITHHDACF